MVCIIMSNVDLHSNICDNNIVKLTQLSLLLDILLKNSQRIRPMNYQFWDKSSSSSSWLNYSHFI